MKLPQDEHDYRMEKPEPKSLAVFRCIKCGGTMKGARPVCKKVAS